MIGWQQWPDEKPDVPKIEHGWLTKTGEKVLGNFVSGDTKRIIEVGTWLGVSTRFMLRKAHPKATIICVDHWCGALGHQTLCPEMLPSLYEKFLVANWRYRDQIRIHRGASSHGLWAVWRDGFAPDVIYIDAGHDFNSVFCDCLYACELFPYAQIVGDDWSESSEVRSAVEKVAEMKGKEIGTEAPMWWYHAKS